MIGVHLRQIPPEGKHLEGEEDAEFLGLRDVSARAAGPVRYELDAGLSGGGVFATGRVSVAVELTCVACLRPFVFEAEVGDFAAQVEIDGREFVDLTPWVREELLLALPNHPRCDSIPGHRCSYQGPKVSGGTQGHAPSAWDKLDKLTTKR